MSAVGQRPAVVGQADPWTVDRAAAADTAATWLRGIAGELSVCLDSAHGAGLAVPPRAVEAVAALEALHRAWQANSRGEPAHAGDRAALGLA